MTPEPQDQQLVKLAKKQQQENWHKAKKNHNVIEYMHFTELATDQSNEINLPTFWCYYDPHGNTTRMSNDPRALMEITTPVTIVPAKASLKNINRKVKMRYRQWLSIQKLRKHCLKILEVIPEGDEKDYMFREQQEAQAAEVEQWEKEKNKERQRQVQEKYQRLKQDQEKQQQQKQKAKEVGAECWEKGENEERQQKLQEKCQQLKQDQEHQ